MQRKDLWSIHPCIPQACKRVVLSIGGASIRLRCMHSIIQATDEGLTSLAFSACFCSASLARSSASLATRSSWSVFSLAAFLQPQELFKLKTLI